MHQRLFRSEAANAIAFANARMKIRYDANHVPLRLEQGDLVYLRLHKGYRVPGVDNRKLHHQRIGSFPVKRAFGAQAYELDLPSTWQIHPVISIEYLEPAPKNKDPFERSLDKLPAVEYDGATDHYLVERLLDRRVGRFGRGRREKI